ncbi:MAG: hypothetical protein ABIT08_15665 [Bacteroidia bacterium]
MKKITLLLVIATLCYAKIAVSQTKKTTINSTYQIQKLKPKTTKWQTYLNELIKKHHGNKDSIKKEILALKVTFKTKRIAVNLSDNRVGGVLIDELLKGFDLPDQTILRMGLEDMMELAGMSGIKTPETLLACMGGGGMAGGENITDLVGINISGSGASVSGLHTTSNGIIGSNKGGLNSVYSSFNDSQIKTANNACRSAQVAGLSGGLGLTPPGSPGYQGAVNAAKGKMENGLTNCDDGINPIAGSGGQTSSDIMEEGTDDMIVGADKVLKVVSSVDLGRGAIESGIDLAKGNNAKAVWGIVSTTVGITGEMSVEELKDVQDGVKLIDFGISAGEFVASPNPMTVYGVIVGAYGVGEVIADRFTDKWAQKVSDKQADKTFEEANAERIRKKNEKNNTPNSSIAPGETGKATCESIRQGWKNFSNYCDGNGWQTYECARFVAMMNGCADPALVNPGPEGSYSCSGRSPADMKAACENQCEQKKKIAQPGEGGNINCGCEGLFDRAGFNEHMQKVICATSQGGGPGDDSSSPCNKIRAGGSPNVTPGGSNPTNPFQTPGKTIDNKLNVTPGKTITPSISNPKTPSQPTQKNVPK